MTHRIHYTLPAIKYVKRSARRRISLLGDEMTWAISFATRSGDGSENIYSCLQYHLSSTAHNSFIRSAFVMGANGRGFIEAEASVIFLLSTLPFVLSWALLVLVILVLFVCSLRLLLFIVVLPLLLFCYFADRVTVVLSDALVGYGPTSMGPVKRTESFVEPVM